MTSYIVSYSTDAEIRRAALLLIKRHGDDAKLYTACLHDEMLERGDVADATVLRRIFDAMQVMTIPASSRIH